MRPTHAPTTKPQKMPRSVGKVGKKIRLVLPGIGRTYTVDGEAVSHAYSPFSGGAHHLWARFVPPHEFWIDVRLGKSGRYIAMHEWFEYLLMMEKGWPYEKAHNAANALEGDLRNGGTTPREIFHKVRKHLDHFFSGDNVALCATLTKGFLSY